jgi:TatD DNase family protein
MQMPLERILLETDAPFMTPMPHQKDRKRNEPAYVVHLAEKLAEIKEISVADVARQTTANAMNLFGLRAEGMEHSAGFA